MGIIFLVVGLLMIIVGGRGTYAQFGSQLASEFQGPNNFSYQALALAAVGMVGYIPQVQKISRWLLAFILLVILIGNKGSTGFYSQFTSALQAGPKAPQQPGQNTTTTKLTTGQTITGNPTFTQSLSVPGGGGFWNWAGLTGVENFLFGAPQGQ